MAKRLLYFLPVLIFVVISTYFVYQHHRVLSVLRLCNLHLVQSHRSAL